MTRLSILTPDQAHAISLIGKPVTCHGRQYTLQSVEGGDWYVHLSSDGMVVIDQGLSGGQFITEPRANIVPAGCEFGQGLSREVPLRYLKRGVSLQKAWV